MRITFEVWGNSYSELYYSAVGNLQRFIGLLPSDPKDIPKDHRMKCFEIDASPATTRRGEPGLWRGEVTAVWEHDSDP